MVLCRTRRSTILRRMAGAALIVLAAGCSSSTSQPAAELSEAKWVEYRGGSGGEAAGGAEAVVGTGWGTIKGKFVLEDQVPKLPLLSAGNVPVCNMHSIPDESLVVGDGGGVKNIAIYAKKTSRVHEDYTTDEWKNKPVVFDQVKCVFTTHLMMVQTGQTIVVKNSDTVGHNTKIDPQGDIPINPLLSPGAETTYKFGKPQNAPLPVSCNIHPWMKAYMMPRRDPYFAVTGDDGSFEIKNMPAGEEMEFVVWHESSNRLTGAGKDVTVSGSFKVKVADGETRDLGDIKMKKATFNKLSL